MLCIKLLEEKAGAMSRRKQFRGIAKNLAHWCLSRNNDYLGYWAVGQLYKISQEQKESVILLNVLNAEPHSESEIFSTVCNSLSSVLKNEMNRNSMPEAWLKSVSVKFSFESPYVHKYHLFGAALGKGKPMLCNISIITDLGREYYGDSGCVCWVHNPNNESRRYGF